MKITFLIHNAFGIGGTVRSTANLSGALADRHDVEVVSVHRVADEPALAFDHRVRLTSLIDMREDSDSYEGDHELAGEPHTMFPDKGVDFGRLHYTALHDRRIAGHLARTDADVVIATRPILNGYLARDGRSRYVRIGQEHLSFDAHGEQLREDQNSAIAEGLDAFVTVSEADARLYREALPEARATVVCIPNAVPAPAVEQAGLDSKVIVAAGRLVAVKRYDRLVDAFAKLATEHPDWTLRIYGRGPEKSALRRRIDQLGLYNQAFLMGPASPIETEWAKGAVAAVSSDRESFGMTIVEAMHCGVPVVATDCPHGPAEIISHDEDGLLVPLDSGTDGYVGALRNLITDAERRTRLGAAARSRAAAYDPANIADRYEQLFRDLAPHRRRTLLTRIRHTVTGLPRRGKATGRTSDAQQPPAPTAHARATADGGMTVQLDTATLPGGPLDLLVRLRKDPRRREIRVPVPAYSARDASTTVTVEQGAHRLAEGRWDCYVVPRTKGRRHRIVARLVEQARLLPPSPPSGNDGLSVRIPYSTTDGYLALRAWQRPAHAEVDDVAIGAETATVAATLLGNAALGDQDATVTASLRDGTARHTLPVEVLNGRRFRFTLPYDQAVADVRSEHDIWDLSLNSPDGPVPFGKLTGDTADRKKTDVFPAREFGHGELGTLRIKPYFTAANDLALSVRAVPKDA